jgi:GntR family transcriptional regulator, rspAB operon transcriptional repressor
VGIKSNVRKQVGSLRELAYSTLKEDIVQGRLGFGAVLSPRQLGREMGMSFLPVSDALSRLESEGLVETRDRVGTRVKIPTVEDIEGVFTVREALESQVARLCAERATQEQRRRLKTVSRQVDERYTESNRRPVSLKEWLETSNFHIAFHRLIADFARCPRLREEIEKSQVLTFKIQFDNALRRKKRPRNWHQLLANAVVKGDPAAADAAARIHVRYGMADFISFVQEMSIEDRWRNS